MNDAAPRRRKRRERRERDEGSGRAPSIGFSVIASVCIVGASTMVCHLALGHSVSDIVMVYLLGVVIVAMRFGYLASLVASTLSVAALDFFFTAPYLSFAVADKRYVLTFVIMLFVAFVISNLMERIRRSAERTARLYDMSRQLSMSPSSEAVARAGCFHVSDLLLAETIVLLPDGGGFRVLGGSTPESEAVTPALHAAARALMGLPAPAPADAAPAPDHQLFALRGSGGALGVLAVRQEVSPLFEDSSSRELFDAFASQIALAIERASLAEEARRVEVEIQKERLRNALLSSVSHDLRTPLSVVKGAVTALLDHGDELSAERRHEYLETISDEASRLNRFVRNLLNMTSFEAGTMRATKEWQPLEEVLGVALNRLEEQLGDRPVRIDIETDAAFAPFDATLLEHVLLNLVENAIRYTPAGSPIEIHARSVDGGVEVEVADRGPGVPPGMEERIFEKFQRDVPRMPGGLGLGLTLCRGIISVHGGRMWCENRQSGGASFKFVLPRDTAPPAVDDVVETASHA